MDRRRLIAVLLVLVSLAAVALVVWRTRSSPGPKGLQLAAKPLSAPEVATRRQAQLERARQWAEAIERATKDPKAAEKPLDPSGGKFASELGMYLAPKALADVKPVAETEVFQIWNPPMVGIDLATFTRLKANPNAWACNVQYAAVADRENYVAPKPEDFAPPGGLIKLCSEDGTTIYEIDQGPLAGAFLSDPGHDALTLANLDYVKAQQMPMNDCLVKTGRLEAP